MQLTMFMGSEPKRIGKPVRLIELFAGYGSQAFALEYLGVNFESWRICEWAVKSIQAYKDAHCAEDCTDYSEGLTDEEILNYLTAKGISADYNKPMTREQIKRLGAQKQRQIYNNIIATHNLVNIQQVRAVDLGITETDKYEYVMTYSFPCQDLSKAGLGKGMEKGSGTRSGMLWEVERILDECEELPQVLLMENVPDVIGVNNIKHFADWLAKLESLGYHCYWQVLNGKDFGVPQNRERCFMVSLLGDFYYAFPEAIKLERRLKDLLEDEVDEKYYLSDRAINGIQNTSFNCSTLEARTEKDGVMPTLCARDYKDPKLVVEEPKCEQVAQIYGFGKEKNPQAGRIYNSDGLCPTLDTCTGGNRMPKIIEPKDGCIEHQINGIVRVRKFDVDKEGLVSLLRKAKKESGLSNKQIAESLNTPLTEVEHWFRQDDSFAIPNENIWFELKKVLRIQTNEFDESILTFEEKPNVFDMSNRAYDERGCSPTLTTQNSPNIVTNEPKVLAGIGEKKSNGGTQWYQQDRIYDDNIAISVTTSFNPWYATEKKENLKTKLCNDLVESGLLEENYVINHSYTNGGNCKNRNSRQSLEDYIETTDNMMPTLTTRVDCLGVVNNYRIRKLTPKECFRLMGVKDKDFERIAKNQSNMSLYHLAGDSIIVDVLMAIFRNMIEE